MKKLVCSMMANRIYYANTLKDGTMGAKTDVTEEAVGAVLEHVMTLSERSVDTEVGFRVPGKGRLVWIPEEGEGV